MSYISTEKLKPNPMLKNVRICVIYLDQNSLALQHRVIYLLNFLAYGNGGITMEESYKSGNLREI